MPTTHFLATWMSERAFLRENCIDESTACRQFVKVETAGKDMAIGLKREHRLKPEMMFRILAGQVTSSIASIRND